MENSFPVILDIYSNEFKIYFFFLPSKVIVNSEKVQLNDEQDICVHVQK